MKKLGLYGSIVLVLLLAASQLVLAGPKNRGKGGPGCGSGFPGSINWVTELKLTDDQVTKIQGLLQKSDTETAPLYDTMQTTQTELRNLGWTKNYSEDKIKALQETIQKTHEAIQANHQKLYQDIYALLTDAQKKIYEEKGGCGSCPGGGNGPGDGKGGRRGCGGCPQP